MSKNKNKSAFTYKQETTAERLTVTKSGDFMLKWRNSSEIPQNLQQVIVIDRKKEYNAGVFGQINGYNAVIIPLGSTVFWDVVDKWMPLSDVISATMES